MNIKRYYAASTLKKHLKTFNVDQLLIQSVHAKFFDGVKYAIENGATIHTYDDAAMYECINTFDIDEEIFKYLLDNGAKITANIERYMSFESKNNELIKYAINKDFQININSLKYSLYAKNYYLADTFLNYIDKINIDDEIEMFKTINQFKFIFSDDDKNLIKNYIDIVKNKRYYKLKKIMNN